MCPCPLTNPSNQFATSCFLDQDDQVTKKMTGRSFGSFGKVFKGQKASEVPSRGRYQKSKCMIYHSFSATFSY